MMEILDGGALALQDNIIFALVSILLLTILGEGTAYCSHNKIISTFGAKLILDEQIDKAYVNYEEVGYLQ